MEIEKSACIIIANAGDSRSASLEALGLAGEHKYEEARKMIKSAEDTLLLAHNEHTKLLVEDSRNSNIIVTMLLAHASDHLANAETVHDLVEQMINILEEREND